MRSKALLVSNILATLYSATLLWIFGGAIIEAGGLDYIGYWQQYFDLVFELSDFSATAEIVLTIVILLLVHIGVFVLGAVFGWIAYLSKKSGLAKFAATLYLIGTICFPIYVLFGLPLTIIGFVAGGKQKKINKSVVGA
jgi:hypothetical protein